jgi:hypothetical protein
LESTRLLIEDLDDLDFFLLSCFEKQNKVWVIISEVLKLYVFLWDKYFNARNSTFEIDVDELNNKEIFEHMQTLFKKMLISSNLFTPTDDLKKLHDTFGVLHKFVLDEEIEKDMEDFKELKEEHKLRISSVTDFIIRSYPTKDYKKNVSIVRGKYEFPSWESSKAIEDSFTNFASLFSQSYERCTDCLKRLQVKINPPNLRRVQSEYMIALLINDLYQTIFNNLKCFTYDMPALDPPIIEQLNEFKPLQIGYEYLEYFTENMLISFMASLQEGMSKMPGADTQHFKIIGIIISFLCNFSFHFSKNQIETILDYLKKYWFPLAHFHKFNATNYTNFVICFVSGAINEDGDFKHPTFTHPEINQLFKLVETSITVENFKKSVMDSLDQWNEEQNPPTAMITPAMLEFTEMYLKQKDNTFSEMRTGSGDNFSDFLMNYENVNPHDSPFFFQENLMASILLLKMLYDDNQRLARKLKNLETVNLMLTDRIAKLARDHAADVDHKKNIVQTNLQKLAHDLNGWIHLLANYCERDFKIAEKMREIHGEHRLVMKEPKTKFQPPRPPDLSYLADITGAFP